MFNEAQLFFHPKWEHLHDPFKMKNMDLAVNRLEEAIQQKQKILLYGDYDVDGTTSVTVMYTFLESQGATIDYYIPDRYKEGYGVSLEGIDYAKQNGIDLVKSNEGAVI